MSTTSTARQATGPEPDGEWDVPSHTVQEFAPRRTHYCVCIPVIDEGRRIAHQLAEIQRFGIAKSLDILILDGGSVDGSTAPDRLRACEVRALLTKTGPGKLSAQLRMGYAYAMRQGYEGVVTIDGNNKDGVGAIPDFAKQLEAGWDLVQGSRFVPGGEAINTPLLRLLAIRLVHAPVIAILAGFAYSDTTNGYRAYSRRLLLSPDIKPFRAIFQTYELLAYLSVRSARAGFRVKEIPVSRRYPPGKVPTKISFWKGNLALLTILLRLALGRYNPHATFTQE